MRPREQKQTQGAAAWIVLAVGLLLVAGLTLLLWPDPVLPDDGGLDAAEIPVVAPPAEPAPAGADGPLAAAALPDASRAVPAGPTGPGSGWVEGYVQLEKALAATVQVYHVIVEEAVNDEAPGTGVKQVRRFEQRYRFEPGLVHSRFRIANLPFSDYGWRVEVAAPDVNGGETVVRLDADHPGAEVQLALKTPVALHVAIKDQERQPVPGIAVTLRPRGRPKQRHRYRGKTDVYGLALYEKVLAGGYDLVVGPTSDPLMPVRKLVVRRTGSPQFEQLLLPRGGTLIVRVQNPSGFPIDGVAVAAIPKETRIWQKHEAATDRTGKARLAHIPPGDYYVHATKKGFDRGFHRATVTDKGETAIQITLHYVY